MRASQYEQMKRFNAASPPPPRRTRDIDKTVPSVLFVTADIERGLALLRGTDVVRLMDTSGTTARARWSPGSRGWVVAVDDLADIRAAAQLLRTRIAEKQVPL